MTAEDLVYRTHPNGGLVIVPDDVAVRSDTIYRALRNARTWGEFRILLPEGEWEVIVGKLREIDEFYDDDGVAIWEFSHHPFDGYNDIPGASDGDYPPWLQQSMHEYVPLSMLQTFGTRVESVVNGYYWHISEESSVEFLEELEAAGYRVAFNDNLEFF